MAPRTKVKDYDQFQLRLPPGMRDRIKAKADRAGMSMNEAIVYVLEASFPAPATLEQKIEELAFMVATLKDGANVGTQVDLITDEIGKALYGVAEGKLAAPTSFRDKVAEHLKEWNAAAAEDSIDLMDDATYGDRFQVRRGDPFSDRSDGS